MVTLVPSGPVSTLALPARRTKPSISFCPSPPSLGAPGSAGMPTPSSRTTSFQPSRRRLEPDFDPSALPPLKGVLGGIGHEFVDDQSDRDGAVARDRAMVTRSRA